MTIGPLIPDYVPRHFPSGTTLKFTRSLDGFAPADGWTYTLYLNGATSIFNKQATSFDDATFLVDLLASDTAALPAGPYRYSERLSRPSTNFTLTQAQAQSGNAVYSFSAFTGPAPAVGMVVTIAGFTNGGNNLTAEIIAISGATSGTFTIANANSVNETTTASGVVAAEAFDVTGDELVINIEPNLAVSPAGTFLTFAEKTLSVIESAITGRLTADIQSYQIAGRAVNKIPIKELLDMRGMYKAMVWRLTHPGTLGKPYKTEFTTEGDHAQYPPTWQDVTGLDRA